MEKDIFNIEQWEKPVNLQDGMKIIRKIKEMFPIAGIVWQPEDVVQFGVNHDPEINVPDYIAVEVIENMEHVKDYNYGLTWDLLADILDQKIEDHQEYDDEPGLCAWCNGSGEGMHDGTTCTHCKGSGEERRNKDG